MAIDRVKQMGVVHAEALELFKRKNADYGDAFAEFGVVGILVRMGDKLKRYLNVSSKGINLVNDESLRDTLIDLNNYTALALMLLNEQSATKEEKKEPYKWVDFAEWQNYKNFKYPELIISS